VSSSSTNRPDKIIFADFPAGGFVQKTKFSTDAESPPRIPKTNWIYTGFQKALLDHESYGIDHPSIIDF
jgi:hypothetical protein